MSRQGDSNDGESATGSSASSTTGSSLEMDRGGVCIGKLPSGKPAFVRYRARKIKTTGSLLGDALFNPVRSASRGDESPPYTILPDDSGSEPSSPPESQAVPIPLQFQQPQTQPQLQPQFPPQLQAQQPFLPDNMMNFNQSMLPGPMWQNIDLTKPDLKNLEKNRGVYIFVPMYQYPPWGNFPKEPSVFPVQPTYPPAPQPPHTSQPPRRCPSRSVSSCRKCRCTCASDTESGNDSTYESDAPIRCRKSSKHKRKEKEKIKKRRDSRKSTKARYSSSSESESESDEKYERKSRSGPRIQPVGTGTYQPQHTPFQPAGNHFQGQVPQTMPQFIGEETKIYNPTHGVTAVPNNYYTPQVPQPMPQTAPHPGQPIGGGNTNVYTPLGTVNPGLSAAPAQETTGGSGGHHGFIVEDTIQPPSMGAYPQVQQYPPMNTAPTHVNNDNSPPSFEKFKESYDNTIRAYASGNNKQAQEKFPVRYYNPNTGQVQNPPAHSGPPKRTPYPQDEQRDQRPLKAAHDGPPARSGYWYEHAYDTEEGEPRHRHRRSRSRSRDRSYSRHRQPRGYISGDDYAHSRRSDAEERRSRRRPDELDAPPRRKQTRFESLTMR
ncbi:hypothetical protein FQN55_001407 [Onygenales sp. PD_40]|nr:hypothetical protein FQN55_001407 [Onygenales sp. PD_40]